MELLYVVELDVRPSKVSTIEIGGVRSRVLEHVLAWLHHERENVIGLAAFDAPGNAIVTSDRPDRPDKRLSWTTDGTSEQRATILTVRTEIRSSGHADFICNVTVFEIVGTRLAVRLELAREALDGVLAPAGIDFFRRPHLLHLLLHDADIQCWAGPSRVDGRFNWVNQKHVDVVWDAISSRERLLPILLVDAHDDAGSTLAWRCADELAGLAPVLAVDARAGRLLEGRLNEIDASIPGSGLRLIWPNLELRHPSFSGNQANLAPGRLLRMLSSVSVSVRGTNNLLRSAGVARRAARNEEIAAELSAARAGGDVEQELASQLQVIENLKSDVEQFETWIVELEQERDGLKAKAGQAAFWREEAERARQSAGIRETDWAEAPALEDSDLGGLATYLEKQSEGAIVFTPAAHRAWKNDRYAHPDLMGAALVRLAQAAVEYRRLACQLGTVPDSWFKHQWDLNLASSDQYMSRNRIDTFEYDGRSHSRLPHLKLGDHTAPNEVGRVYFAMDSEAERFIVDHVGLKLYGL